MKRLKFSDGKILSILKQAERGAAPLPICVVNMAGAALLFADAE